MTTPNIDDRISRMEGALPYLATKADVESLRTDLKTEVGSLRADMYRDMYRMEARLIKWMVGGIAAMTVISSTIMFTIIRFLGS